MYSPKSTSTPTVVYHPPTNIERTKLSPCGRGNRKTLWYINGDVFDSRETPPSHACSSCLSIP